MAKAKVTYRKVESPIEKVDLTLTGKEAEFLRNLLHSGVVGDMRGPRRHSSKISAALSAAGVKETMSFDQRIDVDYYRGGCE